MNSVDIEGIAVCITIMVCFIALATCTVKVSPRGVSECKINTNISDLTMEDVNKIKELYNE